jgi:hypothetical protein
MKRFIVSLAMFGSVAFADSSAKPEKAGDADPKIQGTCNAPAMSTCWDYATSVDLKFDEDTCKKPAAEGGTGGSWSTSKRCASAGRIGRCVKTAFGATTTIHLYAPTKLEDNKKYCDMISGTWQDG